MVSSTTGAAFPVGSWICLRPLNLLPRDPALAPRPPATPAMARPLRMAPPAMMAAPIAAAAPGATTTEPAARAVPAAAMVNNWPVASSMVEAAATIPTRTLGFIFGTEIIIHQYLISNYRLNPGMGYVKIKYLFACV